MVPNADNSAPFLSVVIPAFNEASHLRQVVETCYEGIQKHNLPSFEMIVVDDGSSDGTPALLEDICAQNAGIRWIQHDRNRGLGAALKTGFRAARGGLVTWIPGDGQIPIEANLAMTALLKGNDIAVAIRRRPGQALRGLISAFFHAFTWFLFKFDARNMSGIYVMKREDLLSLPLKSDDIFLNLEVPICCVRRGLAVREYMITVQPRISGKSKVAKLTTMVRNALEIISFRFSSSYSKK